MINTNDPNKKMFDLRTNSPYGHMGYPEHLSLSFNQIQEYMKDPDLFVAKVNGVTKEQYLEWYTNLFAEIFEGCIDGPFCTAITRKGIRCKNSSRSTVSPLQYVNDIASTYCTSHIQRTNR
jgi:hypothetical protein